MADDVPDGDPEVRLSGFGLEDTHSVANSLKREPHGWLYGARTGSTTTGVVTSDATKNVAFQGQMICVIIRRRRSLRSSPRGRQYV